MPRPLFYLVFIGAAGIPYLHFLHTSPPASALAPGGVSHRSSDMIRTVVIISLLKGPVWCNSLAMSHLGKAGQAPWGSDSPLKCEDNVVIIIIIIKGEELGECVLPQYLIWLHSCPHTQKKLTFIFIWLSSPHNIKFSPMPLIIVLIIITMCHSFWSPVYKPPPCIHLGWMYVQTMLVRVCARLWILCERPRPPPRMRWLVRRRMQSVACCSSTALTCLTQRPVLGETKKEEAVAALAVTPINHAARWLMAPINGAKLPLPLAPASAASRATIRESRGTTGKGFPTHTVDILQ